MKYNIQPWKNQLQIIANTFILKGEEIIREIPLISLPRKKNYKNFTYAWDFTELLLKNPEILRKFLTFDLKRTKIILWDDLDDKILKTLSERYGVSSFGVGDLYTCIVTNSIASLLTEEVPQGHGLYEVLSRVNHSCDPNATLKPGNINLHENRLIAIKDIPMDEAITYSYLHSSLINLNYLQRNYHLFSEYGFICECKKCLAEKPKNKTSEDLFEFYYYNIKKGL
jgi:hypothetical protein